MKTITLVALSDITPNRATVTAVRRVAPDEIAPNRESGKSPIKYRNYAIVTDESLVPVIGERVWIAEWALSSGERTITARA